MLDEKKGGIEATCLSVLIFYKLSICSLDKPVDYAPMAKLLRLVALFY